MGNVSRLSSGAAKLLCERIWWWCPAWQTPSIVACLQIIHTCPTRLPIFERSSSRISSLFLFRGFRSFFWWVKPLESESCSTVTSNLTPPTAPTFSGLLLSNNIFTYLFEEEVGNLIGKTRERRACHGFARRGSSSHRQQTARPGIQHYRQWFTRSPTDCTLLLQFRDNIFSLV